MPNPAHLNSNIVSSVMSTRSGAPVIFTLGWDLGEVRSTQHVHSRQARPRELPVSFCRSLWRWLGPKKSTQAHRFFQWSTKSVGFAKSLSLFFDPLSKI